MKEKVRHALYLVIVVLGIVIILKSVDLGGDQVNSIVRQHGGSMDSATYEIYLQECIKTFRDLGLALLFLGGLGEIANILKTSR